ncbi:unnamed protein product [Triticum turgidum subsp. durum]|uniref:Uncharacterized protein n=1 Tax=Triticum turgidum subsp. durum TaxID=4567 RepID=A0A9R1AN46_TRITD|nr:unnamed protein product [Triticum turgidum subsp. durum]
MVAWRESYLDLILIPLGLLLPALYHAWLWRAVRRRPLSTAFGVYSAARRLWAAGMMRDNDDKKGVLVVQSLRNILERSFTLNFIGNRLFYAGVPLLLWIFGPVLAFLSAVVMIPILYNLDMVNVAADRGTKEHSSGCVNGKANGNGCMQV